MWLLPIASVAAGFLSAASPCVLPVLPGYLAVISTPGPPVAGGASWRPAIGGAVGFVGGFTIVFTALGATASMIGRLLYTHLDNALRAGGAMLIVLGLHSFGLSPLSALSRQWKPIPSHRVGRGPGRSVILGAVFGLGWTPCIGPILATVLTKAAASASITQGIVLLVLYSAGLGIPFIGLALWFDRSEPIRRRLARRSGTLQRVGAVVMVIVGLSYVSGAWSTLFTGLQRWLARTGWPPV